MNDSLPKTELEELISSFRESYTEILLNIENFKTAAEEYFLEEGDSEVLKQKISDKINEVLDDDI